MGAGAGMISNPELSQIFDVAPPEIGREIIDIRGKKIAVSGVSAEDWVALYKRYPELVRAAAGGDMSGSNTSPIDAVQMEAAVCAAGFGSLGDLGVERAVINNLSRDERQQVMMMAINLSRPGDALGPLLDSDATTDAGNSG
jgi:hypothetical protein